MSHPIFASVLQDMVLEKPATGDLVCKQCGAKRSAELVSCAVGPRLRSTDLLCPDQQIVALFIVSA
jgi:hypothetical protein